uniref:C2 domain-containing protein n=1 Tax=Arcella intermedia TaxID=1963864 RepID=A0A6B2L2W1_9EUKA
MGFTNGEKKGKKTHIKKSTLTPHWDEIFAFPVTNPYTEQLSIEVYDHDTLGKDDAMGGVKIPLTGLVMGVEKVDWYALSSQGQIQVGLTAVAFDSSGLHPQQIHEVISNNVVDSTQVAVFQPPTRWEIKDPQKFHSTNKHDNKSGWIQLFFDKPYYIGGEVINGRVDLFLNHEVPAKKVMIKWKGEEKSYIENTWNDSDGHPHTDVYKDNKTFFDSSLVLFAVPEGHAILPPGPHTWTFSFSLPPNLPSIFFEKYIEFDGDKIKAAIAYKVKVFVDMPGSDIKAKEKLIISELLTQRVLPVAETKVKSFAFAKGKLKFSGEVGKNVFVPGEVIPLKVKVVNPTSKNVDNIKVKLVRKLTIKAKHFTKLAVKEIARWKFPGVTKKSDFEGTIQVQLPEKIYPSSNGDLVKCHYILEIECDLPWAFDAVIKPKVVIALLPAPGQGMWFLQDMAALGGWNSF